VTLTLRRQGVAIAPPLAVRGAVLSAATVVAVAADQGGYQATVWHIATIGVAAAAGLLWLWSPPALTRRAAVVPGIVAAYGLWSLASSLWSVDASASLLDAQRTLLYLAAAFAFAVAGAGLELGVLGGTTIVAGWALVHRLVHGAPFDPYEGRLLAEPLGYANGLGALVAIGAAVSIALALRNRLYAAPLVLLLPALALTNSRAAEMALVVGVVVALVRWRAAVIGLAAAALALVLALVPAGLGDREVYWHAARHIGALHPLAGTGAGTFHDLYHRTPPAHDAHSLYLQALAELGVVGLVLVVALLALPLAAGLRANRIAAVAGLTVFALHAGVDWDWQLPAVTVAGLALATACIRVRSGKNSVKSANPPVRGEPSGALERM
jgi:hypothetical protein